MEWKEWNGKHIFVKLKTGAVYSGHVIDIADMGDGLIFIEIIDKFGQHVLFSIGEIVKIKEEVEEDARARAK